MCNKCMDFSQIIKSNALKIFILDNYHFTILFPKHSEYGSKKNWFPNFRPSILILWKKRKYSPLKSRVQNSNSQILWEKISKRPKLLNMWSPVMTKTKRCWKILVMPKRKKWSQISIHPPEFLVSRFKRKFKIWM